MDPEKVAHTHLNMKKILKLLHDINKESKFENLQESSKKNQKELLLLLKPSIILIENELDILKKKVDGLNNKKIN